MKKFPLFLICAALAAGCNDDSLPDHDGYIWDFANPDVCLSISNAAGDNLLDPGVENNILGRTISVEYRGKTYVMNKEAEKTRANLARWSGLRTEPRQYGPSGDGTMVLKFGEFQTDSDPDGFHGEKFTIDWGDGTRDEIKFDLYLTWKRWTADSGYGTATQHPSRIPVRHEKIWLNGKLQSDSSLEIGIVK